MYLSDLSVQLRFALVRLTPSSDGKLDASLAGALPALITLANTRSSVYFLRALLRLIAASAERGARTAPRYSPAYVYGLWERRGSELTVTALYYCTYYMRGPHSSYSPPTPPSFLTLDCNSRAVPLISSRVELPAVPPIARPDFALNFR